LPSGAYDAGVNRSELFRLLDARLAGATDASCGDEAIWARAGAHRAILVLDLSGFTRLTKKHGILHFLRVHRRAVGISLPRVATHGGRCIKLEADNVLATFARVTDAVAAARGILDDADAMNAALPDDDRVRVCQAIGWGRILELDDDVFGDEVNVTFKLGEDVARRGELLLTEAAWSQAQGEGTRLEGEHRAADLGGIAVAHHALQTSRASR